MTTDEVTTDGAGSRAGRVVVAGRYAGVVEVLAAILRADGVAVHGLAAVDAHGPAAVASALAGADVAVLTLAPGDPVRGWLDPRSAVVAVTWHPADERPPAPSGARLVTAGAIRAELAGAVRAAVRGRRSGGGDLGGLEA